MIIRNRIRCRRCGDIIESTYTHEFVRCSCGAVAVDGGREYLRRLGEIEDMEELSECSNESVNKETAHSRAQDNDFARRKRNE